MSTEALISPEVSISSEIPADEAAQRRLRLTNLLLHYQSELEDLESQKKSAYSDLEKEQKVAELRIKIDNLQMKITALAQ